MSKPGRPPKYKTEEERLEARRASKRKWVANRSADQKEKARKATAEWRRKKSND